MTSILLLTLDRFEITKRCVQNTLMGAGKEDYEILICDNGSTDRRIIDYARTVWEPDVFILNKVNKGIPIMHNYLLSMSRGDYLCVIGNDIELPEGWLTELRTTYDKIPSAGMGGIHCVMTLPEVQTVNGVEIRPHTNVFGTMFWSREVFNQVGYFNPVYTPYGGIDRDYHHRLVALGYQQFYLKDLRSVHVGHDVEEKSPYRFMKNESLKKNGALFTEAKKKYLESGFKIKRENAFTAH